MNFPNSNNCNWESNLLNIYNIHIKNTYESFYNIIRAVNNPLSVSLISLSISQVLPNKCPTNSLIFKKIPSTRKVWTTETISNLTQVHLDRDRYTYVCVCMCVCNLRERERERERDITVIRISVRGSVSLPDMKGLSVEKTHNLWTPLMKL